MYRILCNFNSNNRSFICSKSSSITISKTILNGKSHKMAKTWKSWKQDCANCLYGKMIMSKSWRQRQMFSKLYIWNIIFLCHTCYPFGIMSIPRTVPWIWKLSHLFPPDSWAGHIYSDWSLYIQEEGPSLHPQTSHWDARRRNSQTRTWGSLTREGNTTHAIFFL